MARKKATPVLSKPRAKPRKPKTSSAPGEAAKAHEWLMERASEVPSPTVTESAPTDPYGDAAWLEAERARKLSPKKVAEGYARPADIAVVAPEPPEPEEPPPPKEDLGRDPVTGRWVKGYKHGPGPGRPKGSRNKFAQEFIEALQVDFALYGAAAVQRVRNERPHEYLKVIASTLPKQLDIRVTEFDDMTDDQLDARIRALAGDVAALLEAGTSEAARRKEKAH